MFENRSPPKHPLIMPLHKLPPRLVLDVGGEYPQLLSVQRVVFAAVLPLFTYPLADLDVVVGGDGDQAAVEEEVEVAAEEQAVADVVGS